MREGRLEEASRSRDWRVARDCYSSLITSSLSASPCSVHRDPRLGILRHSHTPFPNLQPLLPAVFGEARGRGRRNRDVPDTVQLIPDFAGVSHGLARIEGIAPSLSTVGRCTMSGHSPYWVSEAELVHSCDHPLCIVG